MPICARFRTKRRLRSQKPSTGCERARRLALTRHPGQRCINRFGFNWRIIYVLLRHDGFTRSPDNRKTPIVCAGRVRSRQRQPIGGKIVGPRAYASLSSFQLHSAVRPRRAAARNRVCAPGTLELRRRCCFVQFERLRSHTPGAELRTEPSYGPKNYDRIPNSPWNAWVLTSSPSRVDLELAPNNLCPC